MTETYKDPATRFVRSLDGEYFMLREAASALELSPSTLRKYIQDQIEGLQPSKSVMFGRVRIYLYTKDDIERMRDVVAERRQVKTYDSAGRPVKYTREEKARRTKLFSRRNYWRRQREKAHFMEDMEKYKSANEIIEEIQRELDGYEQR